MCNCSQNNPSTRPTSILGRPRKAKGTKTRKSDVEISYSAGKENINYNIKGIKTVSTLPGSQGNQLVTTDAELLQEQDTCEALNTRTELSPQRS